MMGLLDGFLPGDWRGLLNAPMLQQPPDMTSSRMPPAGPADETAQPPKPAAPNLTVHALRMKGVSESDIAAALDSPAVMQQLVTRNFGPGANSATDNRPAGYPDHAFNPQAGAIEDDRAHGDAPPWSGYAALQPMASDGDTRRDSYLGKIPLSRAHSTELSAGPPLQPGFPDRAPSGSPPATRNDLFNTFQADPDRNAPDNKVRLAQYAPASPPMPLPMPGGVFLPGTRENQEFTRGFIHSGIRASQAISDAIGSILHNDSASRPPAGSLPIDKTPWSGDHREIKRAIRVNPDDHVSISPSGEVWAQDPDGSWTNHGPASTFTGSGKASGRRGKDREQR
jgi:hypothetical protein